MRLLYLNIHSQTGGLLSKIDEIEHFALSLKVDILAIAEAELPDNSPVPVIENFIASNSSERPSRLVVYVRSDLPVTIQAYSDGLPALMINTAQSSFAFIYSQFTDKAYTWDKCKLTDKDRRIRVMNFLDHFNFQAKSNSYIIGDFNINWRDKQNYSRRAVSSWFCDNNYTQLVKYPT